MTEPVASILSEKYRSPGALEKDLIDAFRRPVKERAFANYYANPGGAKDGGAARNKVQTMPGGGYATIKIELPANWDSLMAELRADSECTGQ